MGRYWLYQGFCGSAFSQAQRWLIAAAMVGYLRLTAVGILGAVMLGPESSLAFSVLPLRASPAGVATPRALSTMKPLSPAVAARHATAVRMSGEATTEKAWSAAGMTVEDFYANSIGSWRSLRSSHNIAFAQLEEVNSDIDITNVDQDDEELIQVCVCVINSAVVRLRRILHDECMHGHCHLSTHPCHSNREFTPHTYCEKSQPNTIVRTN